MADGKCSLCKDAIAFHDGIKGRNSDFTKLLFVLNRPDKRILQKALIGFDDYETALFGTKTGLELNNIIDYCSLTFDDVYITNVFKCVLKSDKTLSDTRYNMCYENYFKKQIEEFKPEKMILFGGASYNLMFPKQSSMYAHDEAIGKMALYNSIPSLIMPHPSRIWAYLEKSKKEKFYLKINEFIKDNSIVKQ